MLCFQKLVVTGLFMALCTSIVVAQPDLKDPYVILGRNFDALGGLDSLRAERTRYMEGELFVAGLHGTIKIWSLKPGRSRTEVDLGIMKFTGGDNGDFQWELDSNGRLQKFTNPDEAAIKRKEVGLRMDDYAYADPESEVFTTSFQAVVDVEGVDCYVIQIANNINNDYFIGYYNTETFLLEKGVLIEDMDIGDLIYRDSRSVDSMMFAFWMGQIMRLTPGEDEVILTKYISNPEIDPHLFEPPEKVGKDYRFEKSDRAENIPFRFEGDIICIPVIINCIKKYWLLDTGASYSIVGEEYANVLGLELQGDLEVGGAVGTVDMKITTLPPFSLQGIHFDEQTVAVMKLKELNRIIPVEIAGILGFDFLSRFVTKIDYANKLLSFYDPETFEYTGDGKEVNILIKDRVLIIDATLDDDFSGSWIFDLGASSMSIDGAYALKNGFTERRGIVVLQGVAGGTFTAKLVKGRKIEFAGFTLEDLLIGFPYGGTDSVFTTQEIGILGNSVFKNFVVYCDYVNKRVILEKGESFSKKSLWDRSGMQIIRGERDGLEIIYISAGTPADKAGFRVGDILKSINGMDIEYFDGIASIRDMMKEEAGTEYTIIINRNGEDKELKLKLADLF